MWVVTLTNDEGQVLRGYGPYAYEDEALEAHKALHILFPIEEGHGLWTDKFKLETFNGYQYTNNQEDASL